jgi:hypothetical protein
MSSTGKVVSALLMLGAVVLMGVGPATAQNANAVLYEVTEQMKLRQNDRQLQRKATASLMGRVKAGSPICPDVFALPLQVLPVLGEVRACAVTAVAEDNISLQTGQGPVSGKFQVVVPGDNPVDGPELVVLEGSLRGSIDLSLAVLGMDGIPANGNEIPLGAIRGTWTARGVTRGRLDGLRLSGTFTGTFRLPFDLPVPNVGFVPTYMLDPFTFPGPGSFVFVESVEYSVYDVPTVRLELTFEGGPTKRSGGRDDD